MTTPTVPTATAKRLKVNTLVRIAGGDGNVRLILGEGIQA